MDSTSDPMWMLITKARVMRFLMKIGMLIHKSWSPRPRAPTYTQWIPSTLADIPGNIRLSIYLPHSYNLNRTHRFKGVRKSAGYPVLINFHGGGFTLGTSTDDARYITSAVDQLDCVVVSVDYRLAPECPFPTAVDDAADAVLWIAENAEQLGIDPHAMALTGFSSGGNLTLSVPVRLHDHACGIKRNLYDYSSPEDLSSAPSSQTSLLKQSVVRVQALRGAAESSTSLAGTSTNATQESVPLRTASPFDAAETPANPTLEPAQVPAFTIQALCPFYASTDYTRSRAARRATNPDPAHNLSTGLTTLFDDSYLPSNIRLENPYLSPAMLSAADMRAIFQEVTVVSIGCELDMLCREGADFAARLRAARAHTSFPAPEDSNYDEMPGEHMGVTWAVVKGVPHGWDKHPFLNKSARQCIQTEYDFVCDRLRRVFGGAATRIETRGEPADEAGAGAVVVESTH